MFYWILIDFNQYFHDIFWIRLYRNHSDIHQAEHWFHTQDYFPRTSEKHNARQRRRKLTYR